MPKLSFLIVAFGRLGAVALATGKERRMIRRSKQTVKVDQYEKCPCGRTTFNSTQETISLPCSTNVSGHYRNSIHGNINTYHNRSRAHSPVEDISRGVEQVSVMWPSCGLWV